MAAVIGALRAELSAAIGQFQSDMKQASREVEKFAKDFDNAGRGMAKAGALMTAAITAPFILFAKHATEAAVNADELQGKFNAVFGSTAKDMNEWARQTGDAMGRSTMQMQETANAFGNLFGKAAPTKKEAAELSKEFAQLALDLAAFQEISEEEALDKLRGGLQGATKGLKEFGVLFTDADVKARAFKLGLIGVGEELTANDQVMARASIIAEQLNHVTGELAGSQGSLEEQQKRLNAEMAELGVDIGRLLLPMLQQLVTWGTQVVEWFRNLSPEMQQTIVTTAAVAAALGPLLIVLGGIATGIGAIIRLVPAIVAGIKLIGVTAATSGTKLNGMAKGIAALAAAPLVFEGGQKIGNDLGHQLGLFQASLKFGISMEEAQRVYDAAIAKQAAARKAAADAKTEADRLAAEQEAAAAEAEAAAAEARIKAEQEAAEAELAAFLAAADAKAAADKAAADALQQQRDDADAAERDAAEAQAAWLDEFDRKWKQGKYADDPMQDMDVSLDDTTAGLDLVADTLANMPSFEIGMDLENVNWAIDEAVMGLGEMALYGGDAGEMIKRLVAQFVEMTFLAPALAQLSGIIKGITGNALGGANAGSDFMGIGGFISSAASSMFGGFFADGGTLKRGQWGIVGERGPEPVFAGTSDLEIFPNGSGGGGTTINQTIMTPDANSFRRSERQIARETQRGLAVRD